MIVYIISSSDNVSLAKKLLIKTRNTKFIYSPYMNKSDSNTDIMIRRNIYNADVILAMIDDDFYDNEFLNFELHLA